LDPFAIRFRLRQTRVIVFIVFASKRALRWFIEQHAIIGHRVKKAVP